MTKHINSEKDNYSEAQCECFTFYGTYVSRYNEFACPRHSPKYYAKYYARHKAYLTARRT